MKATLTTGFETHNSDGNVRRFLSGLAGVPLLLGGLYAAYNLGAQVYYDYFFYPKVKDGYIMPTRWQYIVAQVLLWGLTSLALYLSYPLLKFAFRRRLS